MTIEEIQYEAQGIMQEWGSNDSAPCVEFVEKLASMELPEPPSNLDGAEAVNELAQHEQSEVDLEKEIKNYLATKCAGDDEPSVSEIARHFYELGLNTRKEETK